MLLSLVALLHPIIRLPCRYVRSLRPFLWNRIIQPWFSWRDHRFVARSVFGARFAGNTLDSIQRYIYYFGIFEPIVTGFILSRLTNGDGVVIDVGANIGYMSLLASKAI